jgi:serine phosphatase RsbU (regulator of sigma subunit)
VLEVVAGVHGGKRFWLEVGRTVVGRHPSCDVVLESVSVSRQHAAIDVGNDAAWIEDLGSRNGTLLQGRSISGRRPLADGDEILIGDQRLRFSTDALQTVMRPVGSGTFQVTDIGDGDSLIVSALPMPLPADEDAAAPPVPRRAARNVERMIGSAVGVDEVLPRALDALFAVFPQAERGFVLLVDSASQRLVLRASKFAPTAQVGTLLVSRSLMDRVVQSRQAVLSADVSSDSRFDAHASMVDCCIRSVMCVPFVRGDGTVLGILQIDRSDARAPFQRSDLDLLAGLAGTVTEALEQARAHEERLVQEQLRRDLELAHRVQQGLLPSHAPDIPGYEAFDFYEPARQISGDFFNYIPLPDRRTAVVLADVSGKGISAALVMAALSADVRYCLASETDTARAVARINESLCRSNWEDRFATLVVAVLDPAANRLTIVNAGHMPPLLRDADGVRPLGAEQAGLPLGVDPAWSYEPVDVDLAPGTTVVIYTDGISEAMDHAERPYGSARLLRVIGETAGGAGATVRRILDDVERHTAGQIRSDDICLVCLGRVPDAVLDPAAGLAADAAAVCSREWTTCRATTRR